MGSDTIEVNYPRIHGLADPATFQSGSAVFAKNRNQRAEYFPERGHP